MGRADARSAQIGSRDGISQCFQVSAYSSEPLTSILRRNMFSKEDWRALDEDVHVPDGPEVSIILVSFPFASDAEGLTGTAAGPYRPLLRPAREFQRQFPARNAREEVRSGEPSCCIRIEP